MFIYFAGSNNTYTTGGRGWLYMGALILLVPMFVLTLAAGMLRMYIFKVMGLMVGVVLALIFLGLTLLTAQHIGVGPLWLWGGLAVVGSAIGLYDGIFSKRSTISRLKK